MRVGLLTTSYPRFEGDVAGSFVRTFAHVLASLGAEVDVLAPEPSRDCEPLRDRGVTVHHVRYVWPRSLARAFYGAGVPDNLARAPWLAPLVPSYALMLAQAAKARVSRWDALVSHWALPCALVAERVRGDKPHLAVLHSADVHALSFAPPLARVVARATRAWFVSNAQKARFERAIGASIPAIVAPMGLAPQPRVAEREATRRRFGLTRFTALFVGRLVPIKGVETLVDAAHEADVTLLVAGSGPCQPTRGDVRYLGRVSEEEREALFAACDVLVVPSRTTRTGRTEGAPVTIYEAMRAGIPVVATPTGGISEIVVHEENGLLARGAHEIAAAIDRLRRDAYLRTALATNARRTAERASIDALRERIASGLGCGATGEIEHPHATRRVERLDGEPVSMTGALSREDEAAALAQHTAR